MSSLLVYPFSLRDFKNKVEEILFPGGVDITRLVQDHSVSRIKLEEYLSKFSDPAMREAAYAIVSQTKHISWNEFSREFLRRVNVVRRLIESKDEVFRTCSFFCTAERNCSINFFAAYAYQQVFQFSFINVETGINSQNIPRMSNYVYFDDACYSGSQLFNYLQKIYNIFFRSFLSLSPIEGNTRFIIHEVERIPADIREIVGNKYALIFETSTNFIHFIGPNSARRRFSTMLAAYKFASLWTAQNREVEQLAEITPKKLYILDDVLENLVRGISIYICIPYMSRFGFRLVNSLVDKFKKLNITLSFIEFENYSINDLLRTATTETQLENMKGLLTNLYKWHPYQVSALFPVFFDHKVASIVSTLSLMLNCGFYYDDEGIKYYGTILNNCTMSPSAILAIDKLWEETYIMESKPDSAVINSVCSFCPRPIYKLSVEEVLARFEQMKSDLLLE